MAEDKSKQVGEKLEFPAEGETPGCISLANSFGRPLPLLGLNGARGNIHGHEVLLEFQPWCYCTGYFSPLRCPWSRRRKLPSNIDNHGTTGKTVTPEEIRYGLIETG